MGRVNKYLLSQFVSVFGSLFFTLFFITSIIYFIQIARITSIIKITLIELIKLYLFLLPKILIFTLPVTFFIALTIILFRLSRENETIVLFTLGYSPKKIASFFVGISILLSLFLSANVLVLMPFSKELQTNFNQYKKAEAKFNIKATEFGQKFSDWMVFISSSSGDKYKEIVLYSQDNNSTKIVSASQANIINHQGEMRLELSSGKAYDITSDSLHQLDFETMIMRSLIGDKIKEFESFTTYWSDIFVNKKKAKDFTFHLLIALFPVASCFFALSFGIITYRYEKGGIYFFISCVVITYFTATFFAGSLNPIYGILAVFLSFLSLSIIYFYYKILKRY